MHDGAPKPILFSYWRSSCSFRVRIALALKHMSYEYRAIGDGLDSAAYTALNPSKKVPTLCIDGVVLTQSMAILEYVDETRPTMAPLLPADCTLRAQIRAFCLIIVADMQPLQNGAVLEEIGAISTNDDADTKWAAHWMHRGFNALERILVTTAGTYCFGNTLSLADVVLYPQVFNARFYAIALDAYPQIQRVAATLATIPAFQAADPYKMPDAPTQVSISSET
ncbi:maleylacetoacetate isomerase [Saprolegnia parasitica CBS 223.65]|uniref:Maleylacetoacetate isomerase n=1 Tax=Saprolegnia parasitica (strain CBS 223.65) TaxID=695850 RepID=A0A067CU69_SAPPC|nr:maleylacetoacetate isomerase [Saprolegnia parasitica CBS 223.65]KDO34063.1 maleylacetoacetate isomerase [Saprolegnia parasitica CBS 223.65]|eukprot:XP_012194947.1 maleylacetoacetate isomerase [Saprolegnia parasitica CBS 223.65]